MNRSIPDFTGTAIAPPAPNQAPYYAGSCIVQTLEIARARAKYFADIRVSVIAASGEIVGDQP